VSEKAMSERERDVLFWESLTKDERHELMATVIRRSIAFQIRANRDSRGWTQAKLADMAGTRQSVIARYENPEGGEISVDALNRIARAFDMALIIRFTSFSEWVKAYSGDLETLSYDQELTVQP